MKPLIGEQRYRLRTLLRMRKRISDLHRARRMALKEHTAKMLGILDEAIRPDPSAE